MPKPPILVKKGVFGDMKKGQLTVFIIIGIVLLILVGTFVYMQQTRVTREIEAARPRVIQVPQYVQPVKDQVEQCINRLATDGLRRIGDRGGYITNDVLKHNPIEPTGSDAVQFSPGDSPLVPYWWHMSSDNDCQSDCTFTTNRPNLFQTEGGTNIEQQLSQYITDNLASCVGNFETYRQRGCTVNALDPPRVTATVAEDDVFFVGDYPLRVNCEDQSFDVSEYYVSIPLNLREMYELALNITNTQATTAFLEQATITLLTTFSGTEPGKLPPFRDLGVGPPSRSVYWIKYDVLNNIQQLLTAYIPLIQASGVRNYKYVAAPRDVRDPELYEIVFNRQWFLPLSEAHPSLELRFSYLDWWKPYFELNCKGQLCTADTGNLFLQFLSLGLQRYQFAYDLSYPVMVEVRNPDAFNGEGYTFRFMLEQNLRNSKSAMAEAPPLDLNYPDTTPSIFCDPAQRTSEPIELTIRSAETFKPIEDASVVYQCGQSTCNIGITTDEPLTTPFPTCVGGILRVMKEGYATFSGPLDTNIQEPQSHTINLEPLRPFTVSIRNYELYKLGKRGQWTFREGAPSLPPAEQLTTIQLERVGGPYDQPYYQIIQLEGREPATAELIPGTYNVRINSFYGGNLTIPVDRRCRTVKKFLSKEKKCFNVPDKPLVFNEEMMFPYGNVEYEIEWKPEDLRGHSTIDFRNLILSEHKLKESDRIIEDMDQLNNLKMHAKARMDRMKPVIR